MEIETDPARQKLFDEYVKAAALLNGNQPVISEDLFNRARWQVWKGMNEQNQQHNQGVPAARAEAVEKLKGFFRRAASRSIDPRATRRARDGRVIDERREPEPVPVEATLRRAKKSGFLEIEIKNVGPRPFTFLDVQEGCAWCDEFWEVEVRPASGETLKPMMHYSPAGVSWKASIEPGKTYVREIQPIAYLGFFYPKANEMQGECTISVHYRVKHPGRWVGLSLPPPYPTLSTTPLKGKLADFLH